MLITIDGYYDFNANPTKGFESEVQIYSLIVSPKAKNTF